MSSIGTPEIKKVLEDKGFYMYTSCHCNGGYFEKFQSRDPAIFLKVEVQAAKRRCFFSRSGFVISGVVYDKFEEKFNIQLAQQV